MLVGAISGAWRIPITNTTEGSGLHLAMAVATRAVDMKADTMTADTPHPPVLREMITTAITEILGHRGAPAAVTEGAVIAAILPDNPGDPLQDLQAAGQDLQAPVTNLPTHR